ncbi:MAG: hypothetical protein QW171_01240 [Candidatus Bilamarchaeaceae archaeon]
MKSNDKKGFLFVVSVFLILMYILISISVWVKGLEASERTYSELYRESNIELAVSQLTPDKLDEITNKIMSRALSKIGDFSISNPLKPGDEGRDEEYYIRQAVYEYFINGSPSLANFEYNEEFPAEPQASFTAWVESLNASLAGVGVYVSEAEVSDFKFNQTSIRDINYSFKIRLAIRDAAGTTSLRREYNISNGIDITGFVDPAIARETRTDQTIYRRFFFHDDYETPPDVAPRRLGNVREGQGWFYGYLVDAADAASVPHDKRYSYILVGDYSEIIRVVGYEEFGAYILTNEPRITETTCRDGSKREEEDETFNPISYDETTCVPELRWDTRSPFVVSPGFSKNDGANCPNFINATRGDVKCALIIAHSSYDEISANPLLKLRSEDTGIFDIEKLRDYTMCGYYIHNPKSPSYLQRFFKDAYSRNSSEFGIETFLIGEYLKETRWFDTFSALDREMFNETRYDQHIRGMPGCRNVGWCSDDPSTGRFGLTVDGINDYSLDEIDCGEGARCEE